MKRATWVWMAIAGGCLLAGVLVAVFGIHGAWLAGTTASGQPAPDPYGYDSRLGLRVLVAMAGVVAASAIWYLAVGRPSRAAVRRASPLRGDVDDPGPQGVDG